MDEERRGRVEDSKDNVIDNRSGQIGLEDGTVLEGSDGDDLFHGANNNDRFAGEHVDEIINAGDGADTVRGWGGNDQIDLGDDDDRDVIVVSRDHPDDQGTVTRVTNFDADEDVISFTYADHKENDISQDDITTSQTAEGALISGQGTQDVLLVGVNADDINPNRHFRNFRDKDGDGNDSNFSGQTAGVDAGVEADPEPEDVDAGVDAVV